MENNNKEYEKTLIGESMEQYNEALIALGASPDILNDENIEDLPEITPEEMALKFNKMILEKGKLPKKFSIISEDIEEPVVIAFDKKLKLYNRYDSKNNDTRKNGEEIKSRMESTVVCRYNDKELLNMIENNEIFVMMIFDGNKAGK